MVTLEAAVELCRIISSVRFQFQTVRGDLQAYILYSQKEINEGYIKK